MGEQVGESHLVSARHRERYEEMIDQEGLTNRLAKRAERARPARLLLRLPVEVRFAVGRTDGPHTCSGGPEESPRAACSGVYRRRPRSIARARLYASGAARARLDMPREARCRPADANVRSDRARLPLGTVKVVLEGEHD